MVTAGPNVHDTDTPNGEHAEEPNDKDAHSSPFERRASISIGVYGADESSVFPLDDVADVKGGLGELCRINKDIKT